MKQKLEEKIKNLPETSGCYLFYNRFGDIIYVGKSKNLKKRVGTYFGASRDSRDKIPALVREISDIKYIITGTETNALIKECSLIKKHLPKYNAALVRNRSFPFLKIDQNPDYPNIIITYKKDDASNYFGHFYSESDAYRTLELISEIWKTPLCAFHKSHRKRECLRYHLGKCMAPCAEKIPSEDYKKIIQEIINFMSGKDTNIIRKLEKLLETQLKTLEFEKAKKTHDRITKLRLLTIKMKKLNTDLDNKNYFLFFRAFNEEIISVFYIKNREIICRLEFPENNLNQQETRIFYENLKSKNPTKDDVIKDIPVSYLLEISADKMFVEAKNFRKPERFHEYLKTNAEEFFM